MLKKGYIQLFIAQHITVDLKDIALITEIRTRMRRYVSQQHGTGERTMNDADIIKALDEIACNENLKQISGIPHTAECALNLIKRQKAEIERLQGKLHKSIGIDKTGSNLFPFD